MKSVERIVCIVAASVAMMASVPAMAQGYGGPGKGPRNPGMPEPGMQRPDSRRRDPAKPGQHVGDPRNGGPRGPEAHYGPDHRPAGPLKLAGPEEMDRMALRKAEDMCRRLGLSERQHQRLASLLRQEMRARQDLMMRMDRAHLSPADRDREVHRHNAKYDRKLRGILTEEQYRRWEMSRHDRKPGF